MDATKLSVDRQMITNDRIDEYNDAAKQVSWLVYVHQSVNLYFSFRVQGTLDILFDKINTMHCFFKNRLWNHPVSVFGAAPISQQKA